MYKWACTVQTCIVQGSTVLDKTFFGPVETSHWEKIYLSDVNLLYKPAVE